MTKKPQALLTTETADNKTVIHPWYQLFKQRLELVWFKDIRVGTGAHHEFYIKIRDSIAKEGLKCPLVLNPEGWLINGHHRLKAIRRFGHGTLAYKAKTRDEGTFLSHMNVAVWNIHQEKGLIEDNQFMFEGKMHKFTEKVHHLFTENMRRLPVKR